MTLEKVPVEINVAIEGKFYAAHYTGAIVGPDVFLYDAGAGGKVHITANSLRNHEATRGEPIVCQRKEQS